MKRFLKWFLGILFVLLILIVAAVISLPHFIDPNKYKAQIIAQIQPHMMGRELKIPGKIAFSLYPWLGITIGKTVIGNANGFVLKPFMTIEHARAHLRLLSLLSKHPEIGTLELDGVVLNLQRDAEGRNNWSDLTQAKTSQPSQPSSPAHSNKAAVGAAMLSRLKVDGIHLKDVTVHFNDQLDKNDIDITRLNLNAGPLDAQKPIPINGQFNYYSKNQGLIAASAFATTLAYTPANKQLQLRKLVVNTNLAGKALNNKTITTSLNVPMLLVDLKQQRINTEAFHLVLGKMQGNGHLDLQHFSNPVIHFGLDTPTLDLDSLLPAPAKTAPATTTPGVGNAAPDTSPAIFAALIPLKTADIAGTFNIKTLHFHHLQFNDVNLAVLARGGLISLEPQAVLYQGNYQGSLQIDVNQTPVHVRLHQELDHVAMGPLTQALTGKASVTGSANFDEQLFSQGNTLDQVTQQLHGDANFNIQNVRLTLMDVEQLVLEDWYDRLQLAKRQQPGKHVTAFDSMTGTIDVQNGIAYNRDFSARSERVYLSGSGQANLMQHTLDYTVMAKPLKSLVIRIHNTPYDLKNKSIPIRIRGPWDNLNVFSSLSEVLNININSMVDNKKQQARDKLKAKVQEEKDQLHNKLKGLLQH